MLLRRGRMAYSGLRMRGAARNRLRVAEVGAFVRVCGALSALMVVFGMVAIIGGPPTKHANAGVLAFRTSTVTVPSGKVRSTPSPTEVPPDAYLSEPVFSATPLPFVAPPPPETTTTTAVPALRRPVKVMVIGDSVAKTMVDSLVPVTPTNDVQFQNEGILGCGVVQGGPFYYFGKKYDPLPQCEAWKDTWKGAVDRDRPDVAMILVGRWELMDRKFGDHWTHIGADPAYDAFLVAQTETAVGIASATGAKVALATTPYYHRGNKPDGGTFPEDDPARVDRMNQLFHEVAARHPGLVTLLDVGARLSPEGKLAMRIGDVKVRSDGVHIAHDAGPVLGPWLFPQLLGIADGVQPT